MKRMLAFFLAALMLSVTITGCSSKSNTSSTSSTQKKKLVGFAISWTGNSFMQALADNVKKEFVGAGYDCEVASADGDATKQINQIENFVTMGADVIIVMAVDPTGVTDTLQRAMEKGVKVIALSTDTKAYDVLLSSDDKAIGKEVAEMAVDWINKTFPTAKDGEIEVAIFEYRGMPEATKRSEGLEEIKNLSNKVRTKIVVLGNNTYDDGQQAAENLLQTDKNVKAIICYNTGIANGANAYVMSPGSEIKDKSKFGVFGADYDDITKANLIASLKGQSVVRGAVSLGTIDEMVKTLLNYSEKLLNNEKVPKQDFKKGIKITPEDAQSQK